ncbi:MAG: response regulator [Deltaproteobacteria bacterium]|nr:response regulator [Deltaproteobacteria bacterium]MCF8118730.1 response regulator [Deltaproteobacteria bacterium]
MNDTLMIVDDESRVLQSLKRVFEDLPYRLRTFTDPLEALKAFNSRPPAVVMVDQKMPGMTGVEFLEWAAIQCPAAVRIMLTGRADLETAIDAINRGAVFRFVTKPWHDGTLKLQVREAFLRHCRIFSDRQLTKAPYEERKDEQERLYGILQLAGAVCHQINQPLQVAMGYWELLRPYIPEDPKAARYMQGISNQIDQMALLSQKVAAIHSYKLMDYGGSAQIVDIDRASDPDEVPFEGSMLNNAESEESN